MPLGNWLNAGALALTRTRELQSAFDVFLCLLQVEIIVSPHNNISVGIVSFTSSDLSFNRMLFSLSLSVSVCGIFFSFYTWFPSTYEYWYNIQNCVNYSSSKLLN